MFVWLFLSFITIKNFKVFRKEISYLQPREHKGLPNPLLNVYLNDFFPEWEWKDLKLIIFVMPQCSSCHPEIENLIDLQRRHGKVPVEFVLMREHEGAEKFLDTYQDLLNVKISSVKKVKGLINSYPKFVLVDTHSKIISVFPNAALAYNSIKNFQGAVSL
ncbi:hypothetical protein EXW28_28010 (plasmid) [Bacillus mycoides]|uniref:hypothetical protein n=1 Tax=Bacillus TaxID=1386 RepID=UPI001C0272B8|nr:hypothetical protein [Bacillus mycoides]QWG53622.1 hypothetical protein EXW37_28005 [Bacillus mycoides]QWG59495.1 hypothetical protein EXW26_29930 [Bacillus mycoides]QWG87641.1 hypothetical protein EXW61_30755 [Bacillus mycoides]QWH37429.1 hypothetical protein EXW28_28010 [Bacillus mycoides]